MEKVAPAVVNISAEQTLRRRPSILDDFFFGFDPRRERRGQSLGSGSIIDPKGIIVTNGHVVSGASKITAMTKSGLELECEVVGADSDNDLAVLRVRRPSGPLPALKLGSSSDLMIGETIVAIGNPFGLSHTVTAGVVSAIGRTVKAEDNQTYTDFIQTDASINPGNSGGPLVNLDGEMVGVATAIIGGAQGIGFAIPVDRTRRIVDDLLRFGEVRAVWVGLRGKTLALPGREPPPRVPRQPGLSGLARCPSRGEGGGPDRFGRRQRDRFAGGLRDGALDARARPPVQVDAAQQGRRAHGHLAGRDPAGRTRACASFARSSAWGSGSLRRAFASRSPTAIRSPPRRGSRRATRCSP